MKKDIYRIISMIALVLAVWSCENTDTRIIPSEKITSEYHETPDFTQIKIGDAFTVEVNFTEDAMPIEVVANENLHPYIEIFSREGVLNVGLRSDISVSGQAQMKVILHSGYLTGYTGSGASIILLKDSLITETVRIDLEGASKMGGIIQAGNLTAFLWDASQLELSGNSTDLNLTLRDASRMDAFEFSCDNLVADFSEASSAELTVHSTIDIKASGASQLKFRGDAVITNQDLTGASSVVKDE